MNTITEPERQTPITREVDVLVAGGGPAGIGAAVAASRSGARTLLVEQYGIPGGQATAGLVLHFQRWSINGRRVAGGIPGNLPNASANAACVTTRPARGTTAGRASVFRHLILNT